jgi:hypothetical protein
MFSVAPPRDYVSGTEPNRIRKILESERVKCGHEPRGTRIREWLRWRGPPAIANKGPILSSEMTLHKDYNRKFSVGN